VPRRTVIEMRDGGECRRLLLDVAELLELPAFSDSMTSPELCRLRRGLTGPCRSPPGPSRFPHRHSHQGWIAGPPLNSAGRPFQPVERDAKFSPGTAACRQDDPDHVPLSSRSGPPLLPGSAERRPASSLRPAGAAAHGGDDSDVMVFSRPGDPIAKILSPGERLPAPPPKTYSGVIFRLDQGQVKACRSPRPWPVCVLRGLSDRRMNRREYPLYFGSTSLSITWWFVRM